MNNLKMVPNTALEFVLYRYERLKRISISLSAAVLVLLVLLIYALFS